MPEFEYRDLRLFYREEHRPHRPRTVSGREPPTILLLPGNTASSASMAGESRYFGHRFRTIALDPPGTGRSQRLDRWPDDWWSLTADAAAELVGRLDLRRIVAMGSSGGGISALLMAIHHPDRVTAVVADSCAATIPADDLLREAGQRRGVVARLRTRQTHAALPADSPTDHTVRSATGNGRRPAGSGLRGMIHGWTLGWFWRRAHGRDWPSVVLADCDLLERVAGDGGLAPFGDRLASISCPVLLSGSEEDELISDLGRRLEAMSTAIPDCRVFLWPEGSHPLMWTAPNAFRRAVDEFLESQVTSVEATATGRDLGSPDTSVG